jgi:hypothetical protein
MEDALAPVLKSEAVLLDDVFHIIQVRCLGYLVLTAGAARSSGGQ